MTNATDDPLEAAQRYVAALNRNDEQAMAATFAPHGSILDGMAPHVWVGPTASQDWYRDVLVDFEKHGVSELFVKLDEPRHNKVTGDTAYLVIPATMTFTAGGQTINQKGAILTMALRRIAEDWRIAAWAWAKGG